MNEDSWLEAAYEDRNGGDVDTADVRMWSESYETGEHVFAYETPCETCGVLLDENGYCDTCEPETDLPSKQGGTVKYAVDVDTAGMGFPYESVFEECSNDWRDSPCGGELVSRTTAGGFPDTICENHLSELQDNLASIAERYPEIYHYEYCTCYGCSDGSY